MSAVLLSIGTGVLILGALIAIVVAGLRALVGREDEPMDMAEFAKSAVIHIGLYLAFLAGGVGVIDLLQAAVEGSSIAGSNTDLARGLSLIIVGAPSFFGLLHLIDRRRAERTALGDARPHRGWTAYLVAALTTSLIGLLVSVLQITDRLTDSSDAYRATEGAQLAGWLVLWGMHWFWLRSRNGVRGDAHLAIGSIIGLGWFLAGAGAVVFQILDDAYESAIDPVISGGSDRLGYWITVAVVGAVVWWWHWLVHLNAEGSVEGDRRGSRLWYLTVVAAGILPGLIAMLVAVTTMVSGVLIWFLGDTDEAAADFFEPVTSLVTVLFMGFLTWAYHRWELVRNDAATRNDSLRFHDYIVLAAGLGGVVAATSIIVSQLVHALAAGEHIAGDITTTNDLIVAITVLVASASVWWVQYRAVERHRAADGPTECDSLWRKLYLLLAFGVGGVVLGGSLIWIVYVLLRAVLDTTESHDTLGDLVGPVGWAVAVLGAVWYHLGVWRVDRAVLAAAEPPAATLEAVGAAARTEPSTPTAPAPPPTPPTTTTTTTMPIVVTEPAEEVSAVRVALAGTRIVGAVIDDGTSQHVLVAPDADPDAITAALSAAVSRPAGR